MCLPGLELCAGGYSGASGNACAGTGNHAGKNGAVAYHDTIGKDAV
jgi:hypothetical protein